LFPPLLSILNHITTVLTIFVSFTYVLDFGWAMSLVAPTDLVLLRIEMSGKQHGQTVTSFNVVGDYIEFLPTPLFKPDLMQVLVTLYVRDLS
jgi:hypothetical protein